ncbi:MAG: hypothetical protein Q9M13_04525, partial [Mariprofundales bacterium]|nr:hypothetical protein [Mariprofundales bacterium]
KGLEKSELASRKHDSAPQQRLIVIGSPAMFDDTLMDGDNGLFILNLLDWIGGNTSLIDLRSRGVTERPLDHLDHDTRAAWRAVWTFLLPLLVTVAAIWRWRLRVRRGATA